MAASVSLGASHKADNTAYDATFRLTNISGSKTGNWTVSFDMPSRTNFIDSNGNMTVRSIARNGQGKNAGQIYTDSKFARIPAYYTHGPGSRERLALAEQFNDNTGKKVSLASVLDMVSIMAYDKGTEHENPVAAYRQYRALLGTKTVIAAGNAAGPPQTGLPPRPPTTQLTNAAWRITLPAN